MGLNFVFYLIGKPELPRQPGSSAQYEAEASTSEASSEGPPMEPDSPESGSAETNFFHTLDWQGKGKRSVTSKSCVVALRFF